MALTSFLSYFSTELVRLSLWLLLVMLVFVPLERCFPLHKQKVLRKKFLADVGYFFLGGLLPKVLLGFLMSLVILSVHHWLPSIPQLPTANLPLAARLAAAIFVADFGAYWGHRWMHEIPWLWRFHALHHAAEEIDWLVNTRAHPLDLVFPRFCGLLLMYLTGLAQPMTDHHMDLMPIIVSLIGTFWGFFIHANLRWRFGWLEWLVSTPSFHHWHHTNDGPAYVNKNYAAMLPFLDKLFGTYYCPGRQWPGRYGISEAVPSAFLRQMVWPFLPSKKSRLDQSSEL